MNKRLFDLVLCAFLLPLALIPALLAAWAVFLSMGRPVLFLQRRPGLAGKPFTLVKFRTMRSAADGQGRLLPDALRLTALGTWLRRSSLDELPELLNVVRGQMSLVGPRPLLMQYLQRYTSQQMRRHETLPGITGWAQVRGRNALSWQEKFALDLWYVDNRSILLDLYIIALTVFAIISCRGISQPGQATAEEFKGGI